MPTVNVLIRCMRTSYALLPEMARGPKGPVTILLIATFVNILCIFKPTKETTSVQQRVSLSPAVVLGTLSCGGFVEILFYVTLQTELRFTRER